MRTLRHAKPAALCLLRITANAPCRSFTAQPHPQRNSVQPAHSAPPSAASSPSPSFPEFQHIQLRQSGAALSVTLNRPAVHNAFNEQVIAELTAAFSHPSVTAAAHASTSASAPRAVILCAEGPSFSAGADLQWMRRMRQYSRAENVRDAEALFDMLHCIWSCPLPTIALVQGAAYGGGVGLVAACDIAIAAPSAVFALTEVRLGLAPATISPFLLARLAPAAASRLLLTGRRFSAQEALQAGLLAEVGDEKADAAARVSRVVSELAESAPEAVRRTKALMRRVRGEDARMAEVRSYVSELIAELRVGAEGQEGIGSFLERRKPNWISK